MSEMTEVDLLRKQRDDCADILAIDRAENKRLWSRVEELTRERDTLRKRTSNLLACKNCEERAEQAEAKLAEADQSAAEYQRARLRAEAKLARIAELTTVYEADPINARDDPRSWQKLAALLAAAREPDNPADDPRVLLERISPDAAREQPTQEQPE